MNPGAGTVRAALSGARHRLAAAGVPDASESARILLEETLGLSRSALWRRMDAPLDPVAGARFEALVARRAAREPLQHLVGRWPFLELTLRVDRRALVPRPETEDLALRARAVLPATEGARAVDVGTGTGCLALALAAAHPRAQVVAVDASAAALALARENAQALALPVAFVRADLLAATAGPFDLVVANLPYVTAAEWPALEPEVRDHDPREALVADDDGLATIRALCAQAAPRLRRRGVLLLEMAPAQTATIAADLAARPAWTGVAVHRDSFGRERIVEAVRA